MHHAAGDQRHLAAPERLAPAIGAVSPAEAGTGNQQLRESRFVRTDEAPGIEVQAEVELSIVRRERPAGCGYGHGPVASHPPPPWKAAAQRTGPRVGATGGRFGARGSGRSGNCADGPGDVEATRAVVWVGPRGAQVIGRLLQSGADGSRVPPQLLHQERRSTGHVG